MAKAIKNEKIRYSAIQDGETFPLAGIEFIKFPSKDGQTPIVAKNILFNSTFGKNNDFRESNVLRKLEADILPKIIAAIGKENLCTIKTDLTTLDGLKPYGVMESLISIPTMDFYRENVEIFDQHKVRAWWWLATPESAKPHYDPDILWLCNLYIDSTEGDGIPLGNQINQGFALLYLDGMDKLIKYQLGIEYYGRNMDDFWLIHPSKEYLRYCLEVITAYLETLNLTLNGKTQIFPFKNGVNYLGFHTYVTVDGKVIRKLSNQKKRNAQRKYTKMAKLVAGGELPVEKLKTSYASHQAHRSHGNCYRLGKVMDRKIGEILQKGE